MSTPAAGAAGNPRLAAASRQPQSSSSQASFPLRLHMATSLCLLSLRGCLPSAVSLLLLRTLVMLDSD